MNFKNYLTEMAIPKFLYHATFGANKEAIEYQGLKPGNKVDMACYPDSEYGVYLTDDIQSAISFVESAENENIPEDWFGDIVVFQVDTTKLDKRKFKKDPHMNWSGEYDQEGNEVQMPECYLYIGKIPPNAIMFYE